MDTTSDPERLILKILNGLQSGVEVSLAPGEYTLGSGDDDDIQLIDVTLKPAHLRIRLTPGKIEVGADAGGFQTIGGLCGQAGDQGWRAVEPLDVVTAGLTRFALGASTAQWSTVTEVEDEATTRAGNARSPATQRNRAATWRPMAWPVAIVATSLIFAGTGLLSSSSRYMLSHSTQEDLKSVLATVATFPFARNVAVRQEVDGTVYVQGHVESPVERRAIAEAVEKSGVPARVRIHVLQGLRTEIDGLIKAEKVNVVYRLAPDGNLALQGTILQRTSAERFVARLRENANGIGRIDSQIRTAESFLEELERLAKAAALDQQVFLRLERDIVEANGIITSNKIDSWAGFLQTYSRRFGKEIGLRSFVQLQYEPGTPLSHKLTNGAAQPLVFDPYAKEGVGNTLDVERLKRGDFTVADLFPISGKAANDPVGSEDLKQQGSPVAADDRMRRTSRTRASLPASEVVKASLAPPPVAIQANGVPSVANALSTAVHALSGPKDELRAQAELHLQNWLHRTSPIDESGKLIQALIESAATNMPNRQGSGSASMNDSDRSEFARTYQHLLASTGAQQSAPCRPGSRLNLGTAGAAIFWLDMLSNSLDYTLDQFSLPAQADILEAALDPLSIRRCLEQVQTDQLSLESSIYLRETHRNPGFVMFVTRTLPDFDIKITGAGLTTPRFVQTADGEKWSEGAAPNEASRIQSIGELGMAIQTTRGFHRMIYGPSLNWLSRDDR